MKRLYSPLTYYVLLLLLGFLLMLQTTFYPYKVIFVLLSILLLAPYIFFESVLMSFAIWTVACVVGYVEPEFVYFFPAMIFLTLYILKMSWEIVIPQWVLLTIYVGLLPISFVQKGLLWLLISLSYFWYVQYGRQQELSHQLLQLKDDSWEHEQILKDKNQTLLYSKETELELKILQERARIAHDIHDNVGHLLSSAVIQLGALEALNQEEKLEKHFGQLKETIHQGMDSIRGSVHNLHYESTAFKEAVTHLVEDFTFCPIVVKGTIFEGLSAEQNKMFLLAIKESLANIMKHSKATECTMEFSDLPAFYRLRIVNNGNCIEGDFAKGGIGLSSMRERILGFNGQLHVNEGKENFTITIVLPKEESK